MRVVVVGQGGREHALIWRLTREGHEVVAIPGSDAIAALAPCVKVPDDLESLTRACLEAAPSLVVVGPEAPLAAGLGNRLRAQGLPVFGPDAEAARLESSKSFSKEIMRESGAPTALHADARSEAEARTAIEGFSGKVAVKADGLAAGKGVVVCDGVEEALDAARRLLTLGPIVVEERLEGPELSVIALCDGEHLAILPPARDHKRLGEGDTGPNTGGMGAVCPVAVPTSMLEEIRDQIMRPVLRTLQARGLPFRGALYAGLMLTGSGPKVLEFNVRFGDPEAQALMLALDESVPLGERLLEAATGRLEDALLPASGAACVVVLASAGYPDSSRSGDLISGLEEAAATGAVVFHAATRSRDGAFETAGGRVLGVSAWGQSVAQASQAALQAAERVYFEGRQRRRDIGATSA